MFYAPNRTCTEGRPLKLINLFCGLAHFFFSKFQNKVANPLYFLNIVKKESPSNIF